MSRVPFHSICDHCGDKSAEYTPWYFCSECGDEVCLACSVDHDAETVSCTCRRCASPALGFAQAVTKGGDRWLAFMPRKKGQRSGRDLGSILSQDMQNALGVTTHDQVDAACMRLCNSDDDFIRKIFLGVS